jgi:hypothetical protein
MAGDTGISGRNLLQIAAIFCMIFVWSIIVHKVYTAVSVLGQKHSGTEFWLALVRYLVANLAGA